MSPLSTRSRLARDFRRFGRSLPREFASHIRDSYAIDLAARYLGYPLTHPVGKGSGQFSLNAEQLEGDRDAGLAFVVLKTVIAEDEAGARSMAAWAIHETRMRLERRRAPDEREGWTVTWKGRGWDRPFAEYLELVRSAAALTRSGELLAVPSVKYHLPRAGEPFREQEYRWTTARLAEAWGAGSGDPLPIEQDFSPTLAGDRLSDDRAAILRWLREAPIEIRRAAGAVPVRLALKLMNARYGDDFQLEMLRAAARADALVCFNRLWDPARAVAYGGWELSDRNLRVLRAARDAGERLPPLTGTGNVCSGRVLLEYARAGCQSVALHTFFQLPLSAYPAAAGSRSQRALHALYFHPEDGVVAGMLELERAGVLHRTGGELRFLDLCASPGPGVH